MCTWGKNLVLIYIITKYNLAWLLQVHHAIYSKLVDVDEYSCQRYQNISDYGQFNHIPFYYLQHNKTFQLEWKNDHLVQLSYILIFIQKHVI